MIGRHLVKSGFALAAIGMLLCSFAMADEPIADGMSEERVAVVSRIDSANSIVVLGGREYRLAENRDQALKTILDSATYAKLVDPNLDVSQIDVGTRIRYVVDAMAERFGNGAPDLFILGVER